MKKTATTFRTTFLFGALLCTLHSLAQTEKGRFNISAHSSLGFLSSNTTYKNDGDFVGKYRINQLDFDLGASYSVIDNLFVGFFASIHGGNTTSKDADGNTDNGESLQSNVGPQVIYYFPIAGPFRPFIGVGTMYVYDGAGEDTKNYSGIGYASVGGVSYFISNRIAIDLQVQYTRGTYANEAVKEYKYTNSRIYPSLGFSVIF